MVTAPTDDDSLELGAWGRLLGEPSGSQQGRDSQEKPQHDPPVVISLRPCHKTGKAGVDKSAYKHEHHRAGSECHGPGHIHTGKHRLANRQDHDDKRNKDDGRVRHRLGGRRQPFEYALHIALRGPSVTVQAHDGAIIRKRMKDVHSPKVEPSISDG